MKKLILIAAFAVVGGSALLISGCSKDDTTPPVITINGSASVTSSLNSAYSDAGAVATDDEDGTVTVTTDNPVNKDLAGTYTVTYTATDKAGNSGTATRTVIVKNDADYLAGGYDVAELTDGIAQTPFTQTVTTSTTVNNRILFSKFSNYTNNTNIYGNVSGTTIDIPSQTATGIGTNVPPDDHTFAGTGTISGSNFVLNYTDQNLTVVGTVNTVDTYTHQ